MEVRVAAALGNESSLQPVETEQGGGSEVSSSISEKPKGLSNVKYVNNEHVHILYCLLVVLII